MSTTDLQTRSTTTRFAVTRAAYRIACALHLSEEENRVGRAGSAVARFSAMTGTVSVSAALCAIIPASDG
ncbi:MAG: hypothetical protein ACLR4Z_00905 [Butyricicoccaceae bacterium]